MSPTIRKPSPTADGEPQPLPRSTTVVRIVFFLAVLAAGLLCATERRLDCRRSPEGDATCSIRFTSFDRPWRTQTVAYVREARLGERRTDRGEGVVSSKQVLEIVGDDTLTSDELDDLGPLRAFLRNSARGELHIVSYRDPRRVVASWALLGLAALLAAGWVAELLIGRERIYAYFGLSPEDDDADLPDVPAWRPLVALLAVAPVVLFFVYGHHYVGSRATRKVASLHAAVDAGDVEALRAVLGRGVDPDAPDDQHTPPLLTAARVGPAESVALLVDAGAEPDAASLSNRTPLHEASAAHDAARVRKLIDAGADLDATDDSLWTPLSVAAYAGDADTLRLLLEAGADPHRSFQNGATLLHVGAGSGNPDVVRLLLDAGLDPTAVRDDGISVWDAAGFTPYGGAVRDLLAERGVGP